MQFKHPDILWALFLLAIPIAIHLFQLRRFERTPFTNVAMLQKVVSESRKSNSLKKWLLLFTRLALLASLILAFAQPFSAKGTAPVERETVVYLDDSFSMQARSNGLTLLERAVQELIRGLDGEGTLGLFTNELSFGGVRIKDIQSNLLGLGHSPKQLDLAEIQLKANGLFSPKGPGTRDLIVISDFQQRLQVPSLELDSSINTHFVALRPQQLVNRSVDSVYLEGENTQQATLGVMLSGGEAGTSLPVSLYNGEVLIAKSAASFQQGGRARLEFTLPALGDIDGRVEIGDQGLGYDNHFYFSVNAREKIRLLAITGGDREYLERLFQGEEFELASYALDQLDYSAVEGRDLLILDQLDAIPDNLQIVLRDFVDQGGSLVIVPSTQLELPSYNRFLSSLGAGRYLDKIGSPSQLTGISYEHPLYRGVFRGEVENFQYPSVASHYGMESPLPPILSLEGGDAFLRGRDGLYVFSASIGEANSNFKNSPLIVPTFYRMGVSSLKAPELFHWVGTPTVFDLKASLGPDEILEVGQAGQGFIPLQQAFPHRVRLEFDQNPTRDGNYEILQRGRPIKKISFNYPRAESRLQYLDLDGLPGPQVHQSLDSLFDRLDARDRRTDFWKWFVILALLLLVLEVIIQKFVSWKPY